MASSISTFRSSESTRRTCCAMSRSRKSVSCSACPDDGTTMARRSGAIWKPDSSATSTGDGDSGSSADSCISRGDAALDTPPRGRFRQNGQVGAHIPALRGTPAGDAPFDSLVSNQGRVQAGIPKQSHRRRALVVTPDAVPLEFIGIGDALRGDLRHRRQ